MCIPGVLLYSFTRLSTRIPIYFKKVFASLIVVSGLVKETHSLKNVPLTVIPCCGDFELQTSMTTTKLEYSAKHRLDPTVMHYIINKQEIEKKFDFKTIRFDENTSQLYFTKEFDDPKDATEFEKKLNDYLDSFVTEEIKIPKGVFEKVQEAIEGKRDEFKTEEIEFSFEGLNVTLVGKRNNVTHKKQQLETMIDKLTESAQKKSTKFVIEDKNKLKFLKFLDYFKNLMTDIPAVQICGTDGMSGKLILLGTSDAIRDVKLKILEDLVKISETEVKMSYLQKEFLQRTDCQIVNNELKKEGVMLLLLTTEETAGGKDLQAKIISLTKCDDNKVMKRVLRQKIHNCSVFA